MTTLTQEKKKVSNKLKKTDEYRGLCLTCKNAKDCTFQRDINHPVLHCDEFDGVLKDVKPLQKISRRIVIELNNNLKGLCVNCENRKNCTYPKHESGVWRCEDYI